MRPRALFDGIERCLAIALAAHAQHVRPHQDGAERRSQFVGEHGHEAVRPLPRLFQSPSQRLQLPPQREQVLLRLAEIHDLSLHRWPTISPPPFALLAARNPDTFVMMPPSTGQRA